MSVFYCCQTGGCLPWTRLSRQRAEKDVGNKKKSIRSRFRKVYSKWCTGLEIHFPVWGREYNIACLSVEVHPVSWCSRRNCEGTCLSGKRDFVFYGKALYKEAGDEEGEEEEDRKLYSGLL